MSYWGKTDKDEAGQISLPYHMLDVAAVAVEDDLLLTTAVRMLATVRLSLVRTSTVRT